MSSDGNKFLGMILNWEGTQKVMKEEDDRFVRSKMLVDGNDYVLFFSCRGDIYGANINAQATFAVMKNPLDEPGYEEMSFSATNLSKAMKGDPKVEIFIYKDIENIKVIKDKNKVRELLMRHKVNKNDAEVDEKMRGIQVHLANKPKDGRLRLNKS